MTGSNETTKVLVLGNDPQINSIEFSKLSPRVKTLGVNRIWLKHVTDHLFFHDIEILKELERNPELCVQVQSSSNVFSSDWVRHNLNRSIPGWVKVYRRSNKIRFPDSVTTAIDLFSSNVVGTRNVTYYLAGVSLKWTNPSHFWKELEYDSLNKMGEDWYARRFTKMFENFKYLKSKGIRIVSVNPNSMLNKIFRYENIENLYR